MKKIDTEKSLIFSREVDDLKKSLEYLDQEGYFSDHPHDFSENVEDTLKSIAVGKYEIYPYETTYDGHYFGYFIPKSKVVFIEEEPKKLRPYMGLAELPFVIGDIIRYRCKQCCSEYKGIVIEVEYQKNYPYEIDSIIIGGINATPQELFDHYELLGDDCQYKPFGVEE